MRRLSVLLLSATALAAPALGQTTAPPIAPATIVTATRIPTALADLGGTATVITRADLERHQDRLVEDALRRVPGLAVGRSGPRGGLTQVRIRGAEANHVLVLIDGIEVGNPVGGNEFDFSTLLAADVERIEVLRGPQSVLYGSDAAAGVISITTRRGDGAPTGYARVEGGSRGTFGAATGVSGSSGRVGYGLTAAYERTDGVSAWAGGTEADGFANRTVAGNLQVDATDALTFGASVRVSRSDSEFDDVFGGADTTDSATTDQLFGRVEGIWTAWDDRVTTTLGLARAATDYESRSASGVYVSHGVRTTLGVESVIEATDTLQVAVGAQTERETFEAAFGGVPSAPDAATRTHGVFASAQYAPTEALTLTAGGRYDRHSEFGGHLTYQATGSYTLPTDTRLHASWGTGFKAPTYFEQFGFPPSYVANPDLGPETSRGWDAGVEQRFLEGALRVDATYFETRIDGLIEAEYLSFSPFQVRYVNTGQGVARGVELTLGAVLGRATLDGALTWTRSEDPRTGDRRLRVPQFQASATLGYAFTDRFDGYAAVQHVGARADTDFATGQRVTLAPYTLVTLGGSYAVSETVEVFGRIENVLDEDYEEVAGYGAPGRGVFLGATLRF